MTCHHSKGDPDCGKNSYSYEPQPSVSSDTPDPTNYTIENVERVGEHLVIRAKYPNCQRCSFEGMKCMVFMNVTELDALRWREIDPHFREPKKQLKKNAAPSPRARFPGDDEGWKDAISFARSKCTNR